MIALTALTATPGPAGTMRVTPTVTGNEPVVDTITGTDENGNTATVVITREAEALAADLNAADLANGKAPAGRIVYTHTNPACSLSADGSGFVWTSAP